MKQLDRTTSQPNLKKVRSWRSRLLRYALFLVSFLLILVLLAGSFGIFWFGYRPLPQTSGSIQLPGLTGEVKVVRDNSGVPHIAAANSADLFIAQGYVTAQDRRWQLDFFRRVGAGRLSEVLGSAAVDQDRFLRTIGLRRAAQAEMPGIGAEELQILENYSKGVNLFIDTHKDNLPIEFNLLGYVPEPWTPLDSVSWGKYMAYDLSGNFSREILRASLVDKLGADKAAFLLPTNPAENTPLIVPNGVNYAGMDKALALVDLQSELSALAGSDPASQGSNNWVVGGAKTTTGKPMLANDPHLGIRNPSIWYEIGLEAPGWNVDGVTFPGVPGVVVGHNDRIAWGVTNVGGDTQDLYMEKINPANPNQYEFQGVWQELQVVPEQIKVKGKDSIAMDVRITRHGPIMNDVVKMDGSQPMALQWTALKNAPLIGSVLKYNRAKNWTEFREALRGFSSPAQNFVFADVDGNIGYQIPGLWPIRAKGDGLLPVPGWTGEYEWTGYASFEELPSVYNPSTNFIATANNRPVPANFSQKFSLGEEFDPGWRAARITELLTAKQKLSIEDLTAIQNDVVSLPGREIGAALASLSDSDAKTGSAVKRLKNWDGRMTADSVPAALYKVATQYAFDNMFKDKLGTVYDRYLDESRFYLPLTLKLLKDPTNEWWGAGGRDALLQKSLGQAVDYLNSKFGGNMDDWKWGKLHTLSFSHTPLGPALPFPLTLVLNQKTLERAGDGQTVAAASYDYVDSGFAQTSGQSFRTVMSLANFDDSVIVNTLGESGQPFSKHWGDNIDDWNGGRYHQFLFSSSAVNAKTEATLTLHP